MGGTINHVFLKKKKTKGNDSRGKPKAAAVSIQLTSYTRGKERLRPDK